MFIKLLLDYILLDAEQYAKWSTFYKVQLQKKKREILHIIFSLLGMSIFNYITFTLVAIGSVPYELHALKEATVLTVGHKDITGIL